MVSQSHALDTCHVQDVNKIFSIHFFFVLFSALILSPGSNVDASDGECVYAYAPIVFTYLYMITFQIRVFP